MLTSFGSFESYYADVLLTGRTGGTEIAAIGSVQSFLMVFLGFVAGPLFDMGYFRHLLVTGSLLVVAGTMLQSACTQFWQLLLAQGLCVGVGTGCLAILSVGLPGLWFDTRLPLANGLAACGSGVGGVVFPIVFRSLKNSPTVGFAWAVRAIGFIQLVTLTFAVFAMRMPPASSQNKGGAQRRRALWDPTAIKDMPYCLFVLACFVTFLGLYVPYFYVPSYATRLWSASSQQRPSQLTGDDLLSILNGASIVGRLLLGSLAISWGPHNIIAGVACCASLVTLCFLSLTTADLASVVAIVCAYGFLSGAFFALQPTVFVRISADRPHLIGTRFGMAFTVMAFGMLSGTPIAGALKSAHGFGAAWIYAGVCIFCGAVIIFASLLKRKGSIWSAR